MPRPLFLPLSTHLYRIDLEAYWAGGSPRGGDLDPGETCEPSPAALRTEAIPQKPRHAWTFFPTVPRSLWNRLHRIRS